MERTIPEQHEYSMPDISIPFNVLYHPKLSNTEKILYGIIRNLSTTEKGCFATNSYLAGLLNSSKETVTRCIANLKYYELIIAEDILHGPHNTREIFLNPDYDYIFARMLSKKGYKKITMGVVKNAYPPIQKRLGKYYTTYNIDTTSNKAPGEARKIILEKLPEKWRDDKNLLEQLDNWLTGRKQKKASPTKRACELTGMDLAKYSLEVATEALHMSAKNGWTGVFPDKVQKPAMKPDADDRTPEDIIAGEFKASYAKRFYELYKQAVRTLTSRTNLDKTDLAINLIALRAEAMEHQTDAAIGEPTIPSGAGIIQAYIEWIQKNTWIDRITPKTYTFDSTLFLNFQQDYSKEIGYDILQGTVV